jgi:adenylate kinase
MGATRLILLGGPGAGKGTQAKKLIKALGVPQISTGDLLRAARREGTVLGQKAQVFMDKGKLVPDDLIIELVNERLAQPDAQAGYILDGFPRTTAQADAMQAGGIAVERVVNIVVDDQELFQRLVERRVCSDCGSSFHLRFHPPSEAGVCDVCGGRLKQRKDDSPEVIPERLAAYHAQTAPLVEYYDAQGIVRSVDGVGQIDEIFERVVEALS